MTVSVAGAAIVHYAAGPCSLGTILVASSGKGVRGYRWGLARKQALLAREAVR